MSLSLKQSAIDRELAKIKLWYELNYPLCVFCGHRVKAGHLAHLIRRSYSREFQTLKLNTGLAHPDCHEIFDDHPDKVIYLPRIIEVLYIIWTLDRQYFNHISGNFSDCSDIFQKFPDIDCRNLEHHGELLQLTYL